MLDPLVPSYSRHCVF